MPPAGGREVLIMDSVTMQTCQMAVRLGGCTLDAAGWMRTTEGSRGFGLSARLARMKLSRTERLYMRSQIEGIIPPSGEPGTSWRRQVALMPFGGLRHFDNELGTLERQASCQSVAARAYTTPGLGHRSGLRSITHMQYENGHKNGPSAPRRAKATSLSSMKPSCERDRPAQHPATVSTRRSNHAVFNTP